MLRTLFTLMLFSFGSTAIAGEGGGSDGCGLGWQITKKKSFLATTTRGTTNATVPPTFGMTTGSIGCDAHSLARRDLPAADLLASLHDSILVDMARGEGSSLAALAQTMGCNNSEVFGQFAKKNFSSLAVTKNPVEFVQDLRAKNAIQDSLNGTCI